MAKLCFSFTLATRLIGTFGLAVSILMINVISTEFLSTPEHNNFTATVESWTLFGLNWTTFVKHTNNHKQAEALLICVIIYAGCSLIVNALLSLAWVTESPQLIQPWIYMQMISMLDQIVALIMHLLKSESHPHKRSIWHVPISSFFLLLNIYFLIIVCAAKKEWSSNSGSSNGGTSVPSNSRSNNDSRGYNVPKSPSYVSQQSLSSEGKRASS